MRVPSGANLISGNNWDGILVNGISSAGTGSVTIQGNKIGTSLDGTKAVLNGGNGVQVMWNATNVVIGGTNSKKSNLISGNARDGVHIFKATGNVVLGNRIGTDITGKLALANQYNGVYLGSANNTVGGPSENSGNVIAGNGTNGIWVNGGTKVTTNGVVFDTSGNTSGTVIAGNRIGVNIAGATLSNGNDGVYLTSPGEIQLGGTRERSSNIIAGRAGNGSYASSSTSTSTSTRTATATSMSNTGGWSIEVCGTTTLVLTNNQLLTVTAAVDTAAPTITVGSQKGQNVYKMIS